MNSSRDIRKISGFSIVEVLVATVILVTAGLVAIPYFHKSLTIVKSFENKSKCEAVFQNTLARIEAGPPAYNAVGTTKGFWLPRLHEGSIVPAAPTAFNPPADPILINRFQRFGVNRLYDLSGPKNVNSVFSIGGVNLENNGIISYTPLLLSGPIGYLGDLYGTGYCPDYKPVPLELAQTNIDPNVKISIRVQANEIASGNVVSNCDPFWPRSRNQFNKSVIDEPYHEYQIGAWPNWIRDDYGFLVSMKAEVLNTAGTVVETCEVQRSFSLPQDFQNVMDYTKDLKVAKVKNPLVPSWDEVKDNTAILSNKWGVYPSTDPKLQTVFTNIYTNNAGVPLKERRECSQDSTAALNFTLQLEIGSFHKEPGMIPMCLDTSTNWLRTATGQSWAWCQKNQTDIINSASSTPEATIAIITDVAYRSQGWVPCEALKFCGQAPNAVRTVAVGGGSGVRYEFDYSVRNDDNKALRNRLWGCEIKYAVALLDPAGNLAYVKNQQLTTEMKSVFNQELITAGTSHVLPHVIREVNPGIYFKPPPCYSCNCKPCKKGKGGLFGGLFNWVLFIVIAIMFGMVGALLCLSGMFGCFSGPSSYEPPDLASAGYLACANKDKNPPCCKGFTCKKLKAPGPTWVDNPIAGFDPDHMDQSACKPKENHVVNTANGSFKVHLAYKTWNGSSYTYQTTPDPINSVSHMDEVVWQQFNPQSGMYCYAIHRCNNTNWEIVSEEYEDAAGVTHWGPMVGCYPVKTAHEILWNSKTDGKKPDLGAPKCLEVAYGKGPFNPLDGDLWGFSDVQYECGDDTTMTETTPPTFPTDVKMKLVGKNTGMCAQPVTVEGKVYRPAVQENLPDPSCPTNINVINGICPFVCWQGCELPKFMPSGPYTNREMRYFENYTPANANLEFCQNSTSEGGAAGNKTQLDQPL